MRGVRRMISNRLEILDRIDASIAECLPDAVSFVGRQLQSESMPPLGTAWHPHASSPCTVCHRRM